MATLVFLRAARRAQRFSLAIGSVALALFGLNACAQSPQHTAAPGAITQAQTPPKPLSDALAAPQVNPLAARTEQLKQTVLGNLVFLPGGTFEMGDWGSPEGLPYDIQGDARPLHKVTLDGFSMMAYKVTYDDFDLFTDTVSEQRINQPDWLKERAPRKPAGVNWYGAKAYCEWLGTLTGQPFGLPTEAQWEYAARSGGKRVLFATDNGNIDKGRNYPDSWGITDDRVPDIGTYPPNPAGLYGMLDYGSREWVNDWYHPHYYTVSPENNPQGPKQDSLMVRGDQGSMEKVQRGLRGWGTSLEFGGFVFSRGSSTPQTLQFRLDGKENHVMPGYSSLARNQFRCIVNAPNPLR